jgi:hypothetical protein
VRIARSGHLSQMAASGYLTAVRDARPPRRRPSARCDPACGGCSRRGGERYASSAPAARRSHDRSDPPYESRLWRLRWAYRLRQRLVALSAPAIPFGIYFGRRIRIIIRCHAPRLLTLTDTTGETKRVPVSLITSRRPCVMMMKKGAPAPAASGGCRDAAKIDRNRRATLTESRRVAGAGQSRLHDTSQPTERCRQLSASPCSGDSGSTVVSLRLRPRQGDHREPVGRFRQVAAIPDVAHAKTSLSVFGA